MGLDLMLLKNGREDSLPLYSLAVKPIHKNDPRSLA